MTAGELMVIFGLSPQAGGFRKAEDLVKGLQRAVRAYIGVDAIKSLVNFVEEAAHAGTHMLGMATSLGLSTQAFQEWSLVARRAGSDAAQFTTGVSQFERFLREFAAGRGGKRFRDSMRDVGLSVQDARRELSGPDGINGALFKVADAYQKMGNTAQRAAINTSLFGQRARGMAQDLSQGSAALRAQIDEFRRTGQIMSEADLKRLKQVDNTILELKVSLKTLLMEAVATFGPQLVAMLQDALHWFRENKELISGAFTIALRTVAFLFETIATAIVKVQEIFQAAFDGNQGAVALVSALGTALGLALGVATFRKITSIVGVLGKLAKALKLGEVLEVVIFMFGKLGAAIMDAGIALFSSPWGIALAAIAVAVYEIYEHWQDVRDAIIEAGRVLNEFFGPDKDLINSAEGKNFLKNMIGDTSVPATSAVGAGMAGLGASSGGGAAPASHETNVSVTQHITNNGVKGAEQAAGLMGDSTDRAVRHAVANTGRSPK